MNTSSGNPLNQIGMYSFPKSPTNTGGAIPAAEAISYNFLKVVNSNFIVCDLPLPKNLADNAVSASAWTSGLYTFKYYFWIYLKDTESSSPTSFFKVYLSKNNGTTNLWADFTLADSTDDYIKLGYIQVYINIEYDTATNKLVLWINNQTGSKLFIFFIM